MPAFAGMTEVDYSVISSFPRKRESSVFVAATLCR